MFLELSFGCLYFFRPRERVCVIRLPCSALRDLFRVLDEVTVVGKSWSQDKEKQLSGVDVTPES